MNLRRPLLVGLLAGTVSLGAVPLAHAAFQTGASAGPTFSAASLGPVPSVATNRRCTSLLGAVLSASLDVTWPASSSPWVGGYRIELLNGSETVLQTQTRTAAQTRAVTFVLPDLLLTGTYSARVVSTFQGWTSVPVTRLDGGC